MQSPKTTIVSTNLLTIRIVEQNNKVSLVALENFVLFQLGPTTCVSSVNVRLREVKGTGNYEEKEFSKQLSAFTTTKDP